MPTNIIGFGTRYLGQRDYGPDGSCVTTEFATALYLPIVPLRSLRVVETANSFRWRGPRAAYSETHYLAQRRRLCWAQVGAVYGTLALCVASFSLFVLGLGNRENPGPLYGLYAHTVVLTLLIFLSPTWPLIVSRILRAKARRRAGLTSGGRQVWAWAIVLLLLLPFIVYGFYKGAKEEQQPGSVSHPLIWSGPCPASVMNPKDQLAMKLSHCFQHNGLREEVCEFEDADHYLYVACDPPVESGQQ